MAFKLYNLYLAKDLPRTLSINRSRMTISEMFDYLSIEFGSKIKDVAFENERLALHTKVAIDGKLVTDIYTVIPDDSEVVIAYIVSGG